MIGYRLLPSRDMAEIHGPLKRRKSSMQPTNQHTRHLNKRKSGVFFVAGEAERHIGIILSGVCLSIRVSVRWSHFIGSHAMLCFTGEHAFLGMLPLFFIFIALIQCFLINMYMHSRSAHAYVCLSFVNFSFTLV